MSSPSTKTLFQIRSYSEVPGARTWIYLFRERNSADGCVERKSKRREEEPESGDNTGLGIRTATSPHPWSWWGRTPFPSDPGALRPLSSPFLFTRPIQSRDESHQEHHLVARTPGANFLDPSPRPGRLSGFAGLFPASASGEKLTHLP